MACPSILSEKDLARFRTKPCNRQKWTSGCEFGRTRCQYSHCDYWPRRCPFYISKEGALRYVPLKCPQVEFYVTESVKSSSEGYARCLTPSELHRQETYCVHNSCKRGGSCPFAHSVEEVLFHPLLYKTQNCQEYRYGHCEKYYCPHIHGLAEKRAPGPYTLPFCQGIEIPPIPGVLVTAADVPAAAGFDKLGGRKAAGDGGWARRLNSPNSPASTSSTHSFQLHTDLRSSWRPGPTSPPPPPPPATPPPDVCAPFSAASFPWATPSEESDDWTAEELDALLNAIDSLLTPSAVCHGNLAAPVLF